MVDALDLGSSGATCESSSLSSRTINEIPRGLLRRSLDFSRILAKNFNFSTEDVLRGIVEASRDAGAPAVMVGTSEGEVAFFGVKEAVAVIRAVREEYNFPVFLNADHFKSFENG